MARLIIKKSSVTGKIPLATDLEPGELAINLADSKLYSKDANDNILDLNPASTGTGDMSVATYDSNSDGKVNAADTADSVPWAGVTGKPTFATVATSGSYSDLINIPSTFTPSAHTHVIGDVTGLQTALDGKEDDGTAAAAVVAHESASDPHPQYPTLPEVAAATGDIHGVVDRTASTLSFVDATRTLTITPVSGSWDFYYHGTLYTVSSAKSIAIANTSGARFIRIDPTTLALVEGGSVPDFANDVIIAYIYWDAGSGKGLIIGEERHGSKRDTTWHSIMHTNVGTVWRSGGAPTYTLNNPTSVQLAVATPIAIADEDMVHTITHSATPNGYYQQVLTGAA